MGLSTTVDTQEKIAQAILSGHGFELQQHAGVSVDKSFSTSKQLTSILKTYIENYPQAISDDSIENLMSYLGHRYRALDHNYDISFLDVTQSLTLPQKLTSLYYGLSEVLPKKDLPVIVYEFIDRALFNFNKTNAKKLSERFNQLIKEVCGQQDKDTQLTYLKRLINIFTMDNQAAVTLSKIPLLQSILSYLDKESRSQLCDNIMSSTFSTLLTLPTLEDSDKQSLHVFFEKLIPLNYHYNSKYKGKDAVEVVQKFHKVLVSISTPPVLEYAKLYFELNGENIGANVGYVAEQKTKALATQIGRRLEKLQVSEETPQGGPILEAVKQQVPPAAQASLIPPAAQAAVPQAAALQYNVGASQQYSTMELQSECYPQSPAGGSRYNPGNRASHAQALGQVGLYPQIPSAAPSRDTANAEEPRGKTRARLGGAYAQ